MGISLASLGLFGASAFAQLPSVPVPPLPTILPPAPASGIPANPLPPSIRQPASLPPGTPMPRLIPADALPAGTVPGTVMSFQKPAGGGVVAQPVVNDRTAQVPKEPEKPKTPPKSLVNPISRDKAFRFEDDRTFEKRIIDELKQEAGSRSDDKTKKAAADTIALPVVNPLSPPGTVMPPRSFTPTQLLVEPSYVVHRRLLFEELNAERYGWDFGIAQPLISTAQFYGDVVLWPARLASNIHERYDTSAGKCPPGSPVPYFLYPPEITPFGALVGFTVIGGAVAIFP